VTYSNIAAGKKSLFGVSFSTDYRDLNTFHGAEVFNLNLEAGFEFNFNKPIVGQKRDIFNSVNLGLGTNLSFPRYMDPLRLYHIIGHRKDEKHKPLFGEKLGRWLQEDASTRLSLGYNYVDIQDLYQYYSVNANLGYLMQPDPSRKLTIDRTGIDLFVPNPDSIFEDILDSSRFHRESFGKQLFTGLLFRDYLFEVNTKSSVRPAYFRLFHSAEISGAEVLFFNALENGLSGHVREFGIKTGKGEDRDTIRFSHFMKGEIDFRYYYDFGRNTELAFRFNPGIAFPYGPFTKQVPYVKQFYVGGALSNRAWQVRELGPGSYYDPNTAGLIEKGLPFYQTGDIKIDLSLEMRFKLFWYVHGALFLDAANVWTIKEDVTRPGSNFQLKRFYKEFGVGYGYGLRLDFDLFILRLDVGYKLLSPYPVLNSDGELRHYLKDYVRKFPRGGELQIAVGQKF
jgi:outer membrane protein assembly factor BamA